MVGYQDKWLDFYNGRIFAIDDLKFILIGDDLRNQYKKEGITPDCYIIVPANADEVYKQKEIFSSFDTIEKIEDNKHLMFDYLKNAVVQKDVRCKILTKDAFEKYMDSLRNCDYQKTNKVLDNSQEFVFTEKMINDIIGDEILPPPNNLYSFDDEYDDMLVM